MRIIHTGDLHLDALSEPCTLRKESFRTVSSPQRWRTFQRLVSYANDCDADVLLICGDLFHRAPTQAQLREADALFSSLVHTQVVLQAGNHDFLSASSLMTNYRWKGPVTLLPTAHDSAVSFPEFDLVIHGFSYTSYQLRENYFDHIRAPQDNFCHILMLHGGDQDHLPLRFAALEQSGFNYIALGHIHKPHIFPGGKMAYCGSLEPLDQTETGNHGFMQIDLIRGNAEISFIPFSHTRFLPLSFQVSPDDTLFSLRKALSDRISRGNPGDLYAVRFNGKKSYDLILSMDSFTDFHQLYEFSDHTVPCYDFPMLLKQHGSDLLGRYIRSFLPCGQNIENLDDVQRQALYFGIKALLDSEKPMHP